MGGSGSKTTVQSSIPPYLKPYITGLLDKAQAASSKISGNPFSGNFYAGARPEEFEAANLTTQAGRDLGTNTGQGLIDLGQATARGDYLRPESNPYLQGNLDIVRREGTKNLGDYSKTATSRSISGGAYGGDRGQLAQASLGADLEQNIQDTQANMLLQNYMGERQLQQNAGQMIQQGAGLNLLGPEIMSAGGAQTRSLEQIAMDEQLAAFNEANQAPFRPLDPYANILYGSAGSFTDQKQKSKGGGGGVTGDIIGGLLGAGGIASLFYGG
jgi:hypothetical protein